MPDLSRRALLTGLISLVAAPAIVRAGSLMPVKVMLPEPTAAFSGSIISIGGLNGSIKIGDSVSWGDRTAMIVAQLAGEPSGDGLYLMDRTGSGAWQLKIHDAAAMGIFNTSFDDGY